MLGTCNNICSAFIDEKKQSNKNQITYCRQIFLTLPWWWHWKTYVIKALSGIGILMWLKAFRRMWNGFLQSVWYIFGLYERETFDVWDLEVMRVLSLWIEIISLSWVRCGYIWVRFVLVRIFEFDFWSCRHKFGRTI